MQAKAPVFLNLAGTPLYFEAMKHKLLIVDDERINLMILQAILKSRGFDVDSSDSGESAIEMVRDREYTLVLLDILMPEMDGYECCRSLKAIKPDLSVIMLTGILDSDSLEKSFAAGANDYIRKPINEIELVARVNNVIKIKEAEERVSSLNSKLLADLDVAHRVQLFMVPDWLIIEDSLILSSLYEPAQNVSGDIFDFIKISDGVYVIYAGDISGHGVQAALLMTVVQAIIKMILVSEGADVSPSRVLTKLNKILKAEFFESNYLTILFGVLNAEKGEFKYFEAGHPPIISLDINSCRAETIKSAGSVPIGWREDTEYLPADENIIKLEKGKAYFLYTDGIFECFNQEGETLEIDGLLNIISKSFDARKLRVYPRALKDMILDSGYSLENDDITFLMFSLADDPPGTSRYYRHISSSLNEVSDAGLDFEREIIKRGGGEKLGAAVELIINEHLNNILTHGLGADFHSLKPEIFAELTYSPGEATLQIWDKGGEWSPGNAEESCEKLFQEMNEGRASSGRGLFIIKSLACEFSVKRYADVNETTIKIKAGAGQGALSG